MSMKPEDFEYLAKLLKDRSGLVLNADKAYLLESRLMPIVRKRAFKGIEELTDKLRANNEALASDVTEAMTTNESFFFRDQKPFDQFKDIVLPNLLRTRASKKSFRIWCAAASSGQEPYSLAMILKEEAAKLAGWKTDIVGTDLSKEILEKARTGLYSQFEVQRGLPITLLVKYFHKRDDQWEIDAAVRAMIDFREFNLLSDLSGLGSFDVVFCRNVLIYFDQLTKGRVLEGIAKLMSDDGVLFLGGAETVLGITEKFKTVPNQRGAYAVVKGDGSVPCLGAEAAK